MGGASVTLIAAVSSYDKMLKIVLNIASDVMLKCCICLKNKNKQVSSVYRTVITQRPLVSGFGIVTSGYRFFYRFIPQRCRILDCDLPGGVD